MLAAVITAKSEHELVKDVRKSNDADLIEIRLDYLKEYEQKKIEGIIRKIGKPIIITCRKKSEGGFFEGDEKKRLEILKKFIDSNTDYIDVEYSSGKDSIKDLILNKGKCKIIVSYHNLTETPHNIKNVYEEIKQLNPDLIKIVTNANSITDNFKIFELIKIAKKENKKIISFCMGSYGQFSRILSAAFGSEITYASIEKGKESASGQLTVDEMIDEYRLKKINVKTKIFGLIGNPVEHSCSHIIHNTGFEEMKIDYVYLKFRVDKLKEFIEYFKKLNIGGFSITIPHKIEVMKYLDEIDSNAKEIGAVNTILVKNKKLIGYNTDCDGAMQALKAKTGLKGKKVVLLGAGGSARAICYGLKQEKAIVTILSRTIESSKLLAAYFDCDYGSLKDLKKFDYGILINTTPVGMHPNVDFSPIPKKLILKDALVFDIIFNPYKTKLLKEAEKRGCKTISGAEMLINGAALQFKLWIGKNVPKKSIREKVVKFTYSNASHQN